MRLIAIGISPLCGGPSGPPRAAMLLSGSGIFAENIAGGAALGTLSVINATGTPAYTLTDSDGSRVALTGANVTRGATAWDYETHEFVTFTVSVSGVTPAIAPRTFLMIATNVLEVTLAALGLSPSTIVEGSTAGTVVGAITGKTGGSTLTLTDDAGGRFAILGTNLVTGSTPTDYETSTLHAVTIRETHPDAAPRDTALAVTVTNVFEAGEPGPFTLTWTSAASELTNLAFSLSPAPLVGDSVTLYLDNDAGVTSPFATSAANVIDSSEAASGSLTFTGITTPLSPGLTYAKVTVVRGIYTVDSSIAPQTLTGGAPLAIDGTPRSVNGSSAALALPAFSTTQANDIVVIGLITNGGPVISITGGGLTWTKRIGLNRSASDNDDIWYAKAPTALSNVVFTVNLTSGAFTTAAVCAFSGAKYATPFDPNAAVPVSAPGTPQLNINYTTTNADNVLLAACRSGGTDTAGPAFTLINGTNFLLFEYKIVTAVQSASAYQVAGSGQGVQPIGDVITKA